jgi:hypothetical protein
MLASTLARAATTAIRPTAAGFRGALTGRTLPAAAPLRNRYVARSMAAAAAAAANPIAVFDTSMGSFEVGRGGRR